MIDNPPRIEDLSRDYLIGLNMTPAGCFVNKILRGSNLPERFFTFSEGNIENVVYMGIMTREEAYVFSDKNSNTLFSYTDRTGIEYGLVSQDVADNLARVDGHNGLFVASMHWGKGIAGVQIFENGVPLLNLKASEPSK